MAKMRYDFKEARYCTEEILSMEECQQAYKTHTNMEPSLKISTRTDSPKCVFKVGEGIQWFPDGQSPCFNFDPETFKSHDENVGCYCKKTGEIFFIIFEKEN